MSREVTAFPKPRRLESKSYLKWIRLQPCLNHPGRPSEAHHTTAKSVFGSDYRALPFCRECHQQLHRIGKMTFGVRYGIQYEEQALRLLEIYVSELEAG